jgi:hypothetical protein
MHSTSTRNALADQRRNTLMTEACNLRLERAVRASKSGRTGRVASLSAAVRKLTNRRSSTSPRTDMTLADCR